MSGLRQRLRAAVIVAAAALVAVGCGPGEVEVPVGEDGVVRDVTVEEPRHVLRWDLSEGIELSNTSWDEIAASESSVRAVLDGGVDVDVRLRDGRRITGVFHSVAVGRRDDKLRALDLSFGESLTPDEAIVFGEELAEEWGGGIDLGGLRERWLPSARSRWRQGEPHHAHDVPVYANATFPIDEDALLPTVAFIGSRWAPEYPIRPRLELFWPREDSTLHPDHPESIRPWPDE